MIPILGWFKLLPTFGGCVVTVSKYKLSEDMRVQLEKTRESLVSIGHGALNEVLRKLEPIQWGLPEGKNYRDELPKGSKIPWSKFKAIIEATLLKSETCADLQDVLTHSLGVSF